MLNLKRKIFVFSLLVTCILTSGCASIQRARKAEELEKEISRLMQLIEQKDARINQLHKQFQEKELVYKKEREKLYKELNELRARQNIFKKQPPSLK